MASIDEIVYRSKFGRWEERASVRVKPRRVFREEEELGRLFFPPELVPELDHPLVARLGPETARRLLIQHLHVYLNFTAELEQLAVNPVTAQISRRRLGFALPEAMIEDAYKIYTDEAWHAQFSDDLQRQITAATGVGLTASVVPSFMARLGAVQRRLDSDLADLSGLLFTIVSETLISSILADIPRDPRIVVPVRQLVSDHAIDEGVHHAYFSGLLTLVWPQLSTAQRRAIGRLVPEFIRAFLEPDLAAAAQILAETGLSPDEVGTVLTDTFPADRVDGAVRQAARTTVRHFAEVGALEDPESAEAFRAARLVGG